MQLNQKELSIIARALTYMLRRGGLTGEEEAVSELADRVVANQELENDEDEDE